MHRAWLVAAAGFVALLAAAAIRATFGILMEPLMMEFNWSHGAISTAASVNLLVFGLSAPFAASLTDRFGLTRVVTIALAMIAVAAGLITQVTQLWQLYVVWGLIAGGEEGARHVLELLRSEIELGLMLLGCPTPGAVTPAHVT